MPDARQLPEFAKPPVDEVALSVQFEPIKLTLAHLGVLALRFRELGYTRFEQHAPLQPAIERFGPPKTSSVVFSIGPPEVRHWLYLKTVEG